MFVPRRTGGMLPVRSWCTGPGRCGILEAFRRTSIMGHPTELVPCLPPATAPLTGLAPYAWGRSTVQEYRTRQQIDTVLSDKNTVPTGKFALLLGPINLS